MVQAIQVLRFHLLELEKVRSLHSLKNNLLKWILHFVVGWKYWMCIITSDIRIECSSIPLESNPSHTRLHWTCIRTNVHIYPPWMAE